MVHKLASPLTLEDVKHEQLLMVTFSRAAATEFKKRLMPAPVISDAVWNDAKNHLRTVYHDSAYLENCLDLTADFERVNSYGKYRSGLGEFDSVYLLLDHVPFQSLTDRPHLCIMLGSR